ncbi:MAG: multidrug ABC transporter ATP-binding protein [Flavobacteriales bacterium]|nr:multidrug ABC transporter ATP-binding protein [Flavobacteriales bacterium]|tara:strand:- start:3370 stop:4056 length:687 start_codon:yes stop_codon:yes gene_type:complete
MSLEINNISKLFGNNKALDSISFKANPGDIVGILGPNGAGKSTMMKIITGYYNQTNGSIKVCGKDTLENRIETQRKIGYLSEENPLYPEMYVREFLEFICDIHKLEYDNCDEIIELTTLKSVESQKIKTLSKGFQQRVGIAQALIHNPELIVLDEPTSGLDPKQLIQIRKIITSIGKDKTILLSSHIIQEVEAICNRIIIINNGEIIANKKTKDFKNKIEEKFLELIK